VVQDPLLGGALSVVSVVLFSPRSVCGTHVAEEVMACVHVGVQKSKPSRWHGGATSGTALLESRHYYERVLSCFLTVNPQIEHYGYRTVLCCFE
jgi:hypothetical protein